MMSLFNFLTFDIYLFRVTASFSFPYCLFISKESAY